VASQYGKSFSCCVTKHESDGRTDRQNSQRKTALYNSSDTIKSLKIVDNVTYDHVLSKENAVLMGITCA